MILSQKLIWKWWMNLLEFICNRRIISEPRRYQFLYTGKLGCCWCSGFQIVTWVEKLWTSSKRNICPTFYSNKLKKLFLRKKLFKVSFWKNFLRSPFDFDCRTILMNCLEFYCCFSRENNWISDSGWNRVQIRELLLDNGHDFNFLPHWCLNQQLVPSCLRELPEIILPSLILVENSNALYFLYLFLKNWFKRIFRKFNLFFNADDISC